MRLQGKVVVVTGSSGIAAAGVRRFVAEGAIVTVIGVDRPELTTLAAESPGITWFKADLRGETETVDAVHSTLDTHGRVDALYSVAGGSGRRFGDGPIHEIALTGWEATLALNLTTTFLPMREVIKAMLPNGGGSIVVVSSVLAYAPSPAMFATHAYAAAKGAQLALVRATAAQYASHGIRVNAIAPGLTRTPMSARAQDDAMTMSYVTSKQPLAKGLIEPDDVTAAALYLLGDESRAVTGQVIAVDGGWGLAEVPASP